MAPRLRNGEGSSSERSAQVMAEKALSLVDRVRLEARRAQLAPEGRREEESVDGQQERAHSGAWHAAAAGEKGQRYADEGADPKLTKADGQARAGGLQPSTRSHPGGCGSRMPQQRPQQPSVEQALAPMRMLEETAGAFSRARARAREHARRGSSSRQAGRMLAAGRMPGEAAAACSRAGARSQAGASRGQRKPSARSHPGGMPKEAAGAFKSGVCSRQAPYPSKSSQPRGTPQPGEASRTLSGTPQPATACCSARRKPSRDAHPRAEARG